jgi:hypothetical protein
VRRFSIALYLLYCAALAPAAPAAVQRRRGSQIDPYARCKGGAPIIERTIRFPRGRTTAVLKKTIGACEIHEYYFRARAGQKITVHLATGAGTTMNLFTNTTSDVVFRDARDWKGELPETGAYYIQIETRATAAYTLEITIR